MKKPSKVVLVYPDVVDIFPEIPINTLAKYPPMMPMGVFYLAAALEQAGHQVKVFDNALYEYPNDKMSELVLAEKPDVVGFSTTFKNITNARAVAAEIKKKNQAVKVIFGGAQASAFSAEVAALPFVDLVICGEAEEAFPAALESTNWPDNKIMIGGPVEDLNSLPYPARHLADVDGYQKKWPAVPTFSLITSRGCPYRCTFCSLPPHCRKYRARDPINVVDEIELLIKTYGAKTISFMEDNFALDNKRTLAICEEIIKRGLKFKWRCDTRVNNVSKELLAKMKEAGLWIIFFGVESGSQRILDMLKKDITLEETRLAFAWCRELGIETFASLMLGVPGETREEIFASFDFLQEIEPAQFSFQTFVGMPGSPLYEEIKEKKLYSRSWETALIISTPQLSDGEALKMQAEITFRSNLYKLLRALKLKLPAGDYQYHYDQEGFRNLDHDLSRVLSQIKQNRHLAVEFLSKKSAELKLKPPDNFTVTLIKYLETLLSALG